MENQIRNIAVGLGWYDRSYLHNNSIVIALPHPQTVYTLHDADTTTSRVLAMRYDAAVRPLMLQSAVIDVISAASKRSRQTKLDGLQIELTPTVLGHLKLAAKKAQMWPATEAMRLETAAFLSKLDEASQHAEELRKDGQNVVATFSINDFVS